MKFTNETIFLGKNSNKVINKNIKMFFLLTLLEFVPKNVVSVIFFVK